MVVCNATLVIVAPSLISYPPAFKVPLNIAFLADYLIASYPNYLVAYVTTWVNNFSENLPAIFFPASVVSFTEIPLTTYSATYFTTTPVIVPAIAPSLILPTPSRI